MVALSFIPVIYEKIVIFSLIFARISTLFSVFVMFKQSYVSPMIVLSLSFLISLIVLYSGTFNYSYAGEFSLNLMLDYLFQIFIGFITGLFANLILEAFVSFGQIVATQIGLGFASLIDPRFGTVSTLTQFYLITSFAIFLSLNGHLILIKTIVDSFSILPIGEAHLNKNILFSVISYLSVVFVGAVRLSIPIIITIFVANVAIAIITKFAPQINLFSVGINLTVIIGLLFLFATTEDMFFVGEEIIEHGLYSLNKTLGVYE